MGICLEGLIGRVQFGGETGLLRGDERVLGGDGVVEAGFRGVLAFWAWREEDAPVVPVPGVDGGLLEGQAEAVGVLKEA